MLGYSSKLTISLEQRSGKTVCIPEQIMSVDKYPSIISRQMEAFVFITLHSKCSFENLGVSLRLGCVASVLVRFERNWGPAKNGTRGERRKQITKDRKEAGEIYSHWQFSNKGYRFPVGSIIQRLKMLI